MSVFEQELHNAFNESERIESTAKEVENRIKSIDGAAHIYLNAHMGHLLMLWQCHDSQVFNKF